LAPAAVETTPAPTTTTAPTAAPAKPTNTPAAANPAGSVSYAKDVQPILDRVCLKCHGGENTNAGFVVKTYADVMNGSENGPVITPGKSADSTLIDLINQGKMPKKGPKLLPAEIRVFTQWVDAGAPNN
jgi:mono/diheme cytochrome c family protein